MTDFAIYALPAGGGTLALSPDIADHLDTVNNWQPDLIINMLENHRPLATPATYHHFPVRDYDVPDTRTAPLWDALANQALTILAKNGRVLIHCRGGCGRSGMAVLRVMIAAGEAPDAALIRLRTLRPCAIETDTQMTWAKQN